MRPSSSAPFGRAFDKLQQWLSLARKLAHPIAARSLLGQALGTRTRHDLGDCAIFGTPDTVATALYQLWVRRYEPSAPAHDGRTLPLEAPVGVTVFLAQEGADPSAVLESIDSIRAQTTSNWRLVVLVDDPELAVSGPITEVAADDRRIRLLPVPDFDRSSFADVAVDELFTRLEPGDRLAASALDATVSLLDRDREALLVYSDEDRIDAAGRRYSPRFKPGWNPELQRETDYLGDLVVCRRHAVIDDGTDLPITTRAGWRTLLHRVSSRAPAAKVRHLARILYHRRSPTLPGSTRGLERPPIASAPPLISLIVPTHNHGALLRRCVETLTEQTDYPHRELIIVDHDSDDTETLELIDHLASRPGVEILRFSGPFNYSAINNYAVRSARGQLLGLLNNDLEVLSPTWLSEMVALALQADVGAVGAKLLYPDLTVQHGGILLGGGSRRDPVAGHLFHRLPRTHPGYCGRALAVQEVSAVTGACLVMRREVFDQVGGFDEAHLPVAFNDVDLCLRIRELGLRILWTPRAELIHHESASRGSDLAAAAVHRFTDEVRFMRRRWSAELQLDPFYNPNLDPARCDFSLAFPPHNHTDTSTRGEGGPE